MDPDATYADWLGAVSDGDRAEASASWWNLKDWLNNGGFEPRWTEKERARFMRWKALRSARENPSTDEEHLKMTCMVVGGAAVLGIVGYLIWRSQQTPAVAATYQGTQLGPGGSNVPLPANQPSGTQGS
jgi:hypothetical protein